MHAMRHLLAALVTTSALACSANVGSPVEIAELSPVAGQSAALTRSALTQAQSKTVLKLIDNICGDTWCDGDYDFGFRKLTCTRAAHSCTLTLQVFPREGVPTTAPSYWRSCKTTGFRGFASLVATGPNGYQSLQQDYYAALTECIASIEAKLPKPRLGA